MESPVVTPDRIVKLGLAFRAAKALLSAVELDVFTALAEGPLGLDPLRTRLGIDQRGARDFFDALVALGMLERDQRGRYGNTPETDLYLDRQKPTYIGGELVHFSTYVYPHWDLLTPALRTGEPQSGTRATGHYSALYADHAALETFLKGMTGGSLQVANAVATKFPWPDYETFVDIGTAQGGLPVQIATVHTHLTGGGFDLPPVRPHFERYVQEHGLAPRLQFYPGDFLADPLPAADVLILGRVLHNWDLATKRLLLKKAYDALPDGGALIVYERLIDDERRANATALLASLNMLIMTAGGFDFTGADCIGWMREAGFRDLHVELLTDDQSMVVGTKQIDKSTGAGAASGVA
jgi:O-methyltransferase domain/Dimerisation domain